MNNLSKQGVLLIGLLIVVGLLLGRGIAGYGQNLPPVEIADYLMQDALNRSFLEQLKRELPIDERYKSFGAQIEKAILVQLYKDAEVANIVQEGTEFYQWVMEEEGLTPEQIREIADTAQKIFEGMKISLELWNILNHFLDPLMI